MTRASGERWKVEGIVLSVVEVLVAGVLMVMFVVVVVKVLVEVMVMEVVVDVSIEGKLSIMIELTRITLAMEPQVIIQRCT